MIFACGSQLPEQRANRELKITSAGYFTLTRTPANWATAIGGSSPRTRELGRCFLELLRLRVGRHPQRTNPILTLSFSGMDHLFRFAFLKRACGERSRTMGLASLFA